MIDLGAEYPAAVDLTDDTGAYANADTVVLTITLPDQSTTQPAVTNPPLDQGKYRYYYMTTMSGRHVARWEFTNPTTTYTDVFDVGEAAPPAIFSLADAKQQLGITDTNEDDELRAKVAAITTAMENYKSEVIVVRSFTETKTMSHWDRLRLYRIPVISLDSVAAQDGSYTWDITNLDVDKETGLVTVLSGPPLSGRITYSWTAGYQVIPYNYIEGGKVFLQWVWEARRGPGSIGTGVIGPDEAMDYRHMTALPRKVRDWLASPGIPVA